MDLSQKKAIISQKGCSLEVIRKHLKDDLKIYIESSKEIKFRMRNFKDSRKLVNQMEKIRMAGRDLTEDLSVESRRKLVNEHMNE